MEKVCIQCSASFLILQKHERVITHLSPTVGGAKHTIPLPTHCPECRQQRRFASRNDRHYYTGNCDVCHTDIITSYSPDKHIPILCEKCFWRDSWNPLAYGKEFDFTRPFFEQFSQLRNTVPRLAIYQTQSENSQYTIHSARNKNCYMGSSLIDNEEVHYSDFTFKSNNSMDLYSCSNVELCYECCFCDDCFHCMYCNSCTTLSDSMYCFDCKSSDHLLGCIGQRTSSYKILNQDVDKEEYMVTKKKILADPVFAAEFIAKFEAIKLTHPRRATWQINTEHCIGNYLWDSKNVTYGFNARNLEDVLFAYEVDTHKDTCDITRIGNGEMLYECASCIDASFCAFCNLNYQCDNMLYSDNCSGTSNSFGCMSLKKHQYCILNKQYTKEEYEALVPKIIEHMRSTNEWGEFFPASISVFGYNETKAIEWFLLSKHKAVANGWKWSDYVSPLSDIVKTIDAQRLPRNIEDIPNDILQWALRCKNTGALYKIIKQELDFYRSQGIAVPQYHPNERHRMRTALCNYHSLYKRSCEECFCDMETIYSPESKEKVVCNTCYLKQTY